MAAHIKDIVSKFLKDKKKEFKKLEETKRIINKALNKEIKKHIHIKKILINQIVFTSDAPSFTYVFNLEKEKLLGKINKELPKIEKLKIENS